MDEPYQEKIIEQIAETTNTTVEEVKRKRKSKQDKLIENGQMAFDF